MSFSELATGWPQSSNKSEVLAQLLLRFEDTCIFLGVHMTYVFRSSDMGM